ncbi:hypothetical protein NHQ30_008127 [Ciborinia camelliae]|nr:hypothetical protein NHQ30_008127 [Ciborinia camelliae]
MDDTQTNYSPSWDDHHMSLQTFQEEVRKATAMAFPNDHYSRYTEVHALLISWEDEDPDLQVYAEIQSLRKVLEEDYHFEVQTYAIPNFGSHNALAKKISRFVDYEGKNEKNVKSMKNILKIVYYGGHGSTAINGEPYWTSRRAETDNDYCCEVQWSGIQNTLEHAESDVLIILDCCASGNPNTLRGVGATELIAACGFRESANPPGPASFTHALVKELQAMSRMQFFTTAMLYTRVLSRLQSHRPDEPGFEQMKAPIHAILNYNTTNPLAPVIHLSAIGSKEPSPLNNVPTGSPEEVPAIHYDNIGSTSTPSIPDSAAYQQRSTTPGSFVSSMSSPGSSDPEYSRIILSIKLRESLGIDSLSDAVADWIKAMPVSAESIQFEAAYGSFSTLLIISMSIPTWCYFKRHAAITCLGIITSRSMIAPAQLSYVVKNKLATASELPLRWKKAIQDPYIDRYNSTSVVENTKVPLSKGDIPAKASRGVEFLRKISG